MFYSLTSEEWLRACHELKPSEKDVLYYLRTLDPFGEKDLDIGVRQMARELDMNPGTVSRALKELDRKKWIDMEVTSARVKLHSQKPPKDKAQAVCGELLSQNNSVVSKQRPTCGKVLPLRNGVASKQRSGSPHNNCDYHATLEGEIDGSVESLEAHSDGSLSDSLFSTDCTRSVLKTLKKEQTGYPTTHPVEKEPDREGLGTLLRTIESSGVSLNCALSATVDTLYRTNPADAGIRVRNALSALAEQNNVRNAQAFLNAALKKGFTANEAKRGTAKNQFKGASAGAPRDLSDVLALISLECDRLNLNRDAAVQRLSDAYGWAPKPFDDLQEDDLEILYAAMRGWS